MSPEHYPLLSLSSPRRNLYIPILTACRGKTDCNNKMIRRNFGFSRSAPLLFQRAVHHALCIALGNIGALIIQLFALTQAKLQLHAPLL